MDQWDIDDHAGTGSCSAFIAEIYDMDLGIDMIYPVDQCNPVTSDLHADRFLMVRLLATKLRCLHPADSIVFDDALDLMAHILDLYEQFSSSVFMHQPMPDGVLYIGLQDHRWYLRLLDVDTAVDINLIIKLTIQS